MYFEDLYRRLIDAAQQRVRAGEVSERGLARLAYISQPHLHNVLKDIRTLAPSSADRLMRALKLTVPDLLWRRPGGVGAGVEPVPTLGSRVGPGADADLEVLGGYYPFPVTLLTGLVKPVAALLAPDLVLPRPVAHNDLVLLDQNPAIRAAPNGAGCWVVVEPAGLRVRYVTLRAGSLCLANESTLPHPEKWRAISDGGRNILDVVRARIVWISREMETEPAGPAGPAGPGD